MSAEYKNTNVNEIAKKAEQDLSSDSATKGHSVGLSSMSSLPTHRTKTPTNSTPSQPPNPASTPQT
jgi:hypothetical protein